MEKTARGSFEIDAKPLPGDEATQAIGAMRMTFHKKFEGPLAGTSVVAMVGIMNPAHESGAYVALEKFTGSVEGKNGSFCLHHASTMSRGSPGQRIGIVPDSGTDALAGITGEMTIDIENDRHFYTLTYRLA